jgi:predicted dehydrogenase
MTMSTRLRIGLIGVGRWGKIYINTLQSLDDRCWLTHLGARHPDHVGSVPSGVTVETDWRQLVQADCDAVIIATPAQTHAEMVEACLGVGKPCLVEKPLCVDLATAERLHRWVANSGVPVLVNHIHLFDPAYGALKQALASSREPIRAILCEGMDLGPFRSDTPALWDWGPHDLSMCLDLFGASPRVVEALGGPCSPSGTPELASLRLDFAGGASAWIQIGCLAPHKRRSLSVFTDTRLYVLDDTATEPLTVCRFDFSKRYANSVAEALEPHPLAPDSKLSPLASVITYFLDGLAGGDQTYFGTALALDVTRLLARCESCLAAREACGV